MCSKLSGIQKIVYNVVVRVWHYSLSGNLGSESSEHYMRSLTYEHMNLVFWVARNNLEKTTINPRHNIWRDYL